MDFVVPSVVTYEFGGRATVTEVARSLTAQEKLFREALQVLEACFPELEIENVTVTVREVVQNSPLRHRLEGYIVAALAPGLIEDMPQDILQAVFGLDVADSIDGPVSMLVLVISLWGAEKVIARIKRAKKDADRSRVEEQERFLAAERRRLTREVANRASITEEHLTEALAETLSKRKSSVSKASMDFLNPAKRHKGTSIRLPGGTEIREQAIRALPSDVDLAAYQPPTDSIELEDVTVTFYAHDRERAKHWAAKISEVSPHRKPLHLAPDIDAEELFTREHVQADVIVTSVLDAEGEYVPSIYYLAKVHYENAA
jgi:hypothetical protein